MGRYNIHRSSNKNPNMKERSEKTYLNGIYVAEIINNIDISRTGRVQVFIAALTIDDQGKSGYFDAIWTSPFAGSTNPRSVGKDIENPEQSMSSYGWWGQVPDIGNLVLVAFGDGNTKFPFVISCLFPDMFANMVPGIPAGKNYQDPTKLLPTVEKNKRTQDVKHNDTFRPIQHTLSEAIVKQGLINDATRGAGSSGSRRESPSEVFGILTPGPRKSDITGNENDYDIRLGGHQFVMDDNVDSRQIRIRSAEGNQVLLDDNEGIIYLINKSGRAWVEMNSLGDIHIFGEGSINMRAKQNFNLRADYNVNIEAGKDVNIKAAMDTLGSDYRGIGAGAGGSIHLDAEGEIKNIAGASILNRSIAGDVVTHASGSIKNEAAENDIEMLAGGEIKNKSGEKYSIKAGGDVSMRGSQIVEKGSKVLMNSGGADPSEPGMNDAMQLENIAPNDYVDHTNKQPEYDKEGETLLPTGGRRDEYKIKSIVSNLVTSEPYSGHASANPENENEASIVPDESIADAMAKNSNGVIGPKGETPADNNAPGGYQPNAGYDENSNPLYSEANNNYQSNFSPAANKKLEETKAMATAIAAVSSGVKPLQTPTMTPGNYKVIGSGRKISDLEAVTKTISVNNLGERVSSSDVSMADLTKGIAKVQLAESLGQDTKPILAALGIERTTSGGSKIYTASDGSFIIDSRGGFSTIANNLVTGADLVQTSNVVSQILGPKTQVSDNQLAALTLLTDHVGPEKFKASRTLELVRQEKYAEVPNALLDFNKGTVGHSRRPVLRRDYLERGMMYGELFQTPDSVDIPVFEEGTSWGAMARAIKFARTG